MADISNLSNFLTDVASAIRTKKETTGEIPAENFDTEILGIETGIDTSDATATSADLVWGKTAYVNGEKVTGNISESRGGTVLGGVPNEFTISDNPGVQNAGMVIKGVSMGSTGSAGAVADDTTTFHINPFKRDVAQGLNLTPDKIVKGNTILGVEGTGGDGIDTSDADATAHDIIESKTAYVNGEKITGTFPLYGNIGSATNTDPDSSVIDNPEAQMVRTVTHKEHSAGYIDNAMVETDTFYDKLVPAIGLTPDKLVKGNTILGVEGTAEAGSGTGEIKLFETEEQMQADENPQEEGKAVVYRQQIQSITQDTEFQICEFPNTVILDTAFTDNIYGMFRSADESTWFDANAELSQTQFRFRWYGDSTNGEVTYTSEDGITYTRTDTLGNPVDLGIVIKSEYEWNNLFGKFIYASGYYFGGLFEYTKKTDKAKCEFITNIRKDDTIKFDTDSMSSLNIDYAIDVYNKIEQHFNASRSFSELTFCEHEGVLFVYVTVLPDTPSLKGVELIELADGTYGLGPYISYKNYDVYKVTLGNEYVYELLSKTDVEGSSNGLKTVQIIDETYKIANMSFIQNSESGEPGSIYTYLYPSGESSYHFNYGQTMKYYLANTQLTLSQENQLLPNVIAYGKNGIVTGDGSIYNNLDMKLLFDALRINYEQYTAPGFDVTDKNIRSLILDDTSNVMLPFYDYNNQMATNNTGIADITNGRYTDMIETQDYIIIYYPDSSIKVDVYLKIDMTLKRSFTIPDMNSYYQYYTKFSFIQNGSKLYSMYACSNGDIVMKGIVLDVDTGEQHVYSKTTTSGTTDVNIYRMCISVTGFVLKDNIGTALSLYLDSSKKPQPMVTTVDFESGTVTIDKKSTSSIVLSGMPYLYNSIVVDNCIYVGTGHNTNLDVVLFRYDVSNKTVSSYVLPKACSSRDSYFVLDENNKWLIPKGTYKKAFNYETLTVVDIPADYIMPEISELYLSEPAHIVNGVILPIYTMPCWAIGTTSQKYGLLTMSSDDVDTVFRYTKDSCILYSKPNNRFIITPYTLQKCSVVEGLVNEALESYIKIDDGRDYLLLNTTSNLFNRLITQEKYNQALETANEIKGETPLIDGLYKKPSQMTMQDHIFGFKSIGGVSGELVYNVPRIPNYIIGNYPGNTEIDDVLVAAGSKGSTNGIFVINGGVPTTQLANATSSTGWESVDAEDNSFTSDWYNNNEGTTLKYEIEPEVAEMLDKFLLVKVKKGGTE